MMANIAAMKVFEKRGVNIDRGRGGMRGILRGVGAKERIFPKILNRNSENFFFLPDFTLGAISEQSQT